MKKIQTPKKILVLLLTLIFVLNLFPATVLASSKDISTKEKETQKEPIFDPEKEEAPSNGGYIAPPSFGSSSLTDAYLRESAESINSDDRSANSTELPSSYDSRDFNYVTPVKSQPNRTCWAYATIAPIETYIIKHGVRNSVTDTPTNTNIDLSEYHLSWFTYEKSYDPLGMLQHDYTYPIGADYLDIGGNGVLASLVLMRWTGPASETIPGLAFSDRTINGLSSDYAYRYDTVHLEGTEWIPTRNRDAVKRAIMEYGAGTINFNDNRSYMNPLTNSACFRQEYDPNDKRFQPPTHAVTLIGWDDNYPASNFNSEGGPLNNGAWIVKNSWGKDAYEFFYLSYEDSSSYYGDCYFYRVGPADNYDFNYQYDGTCNVDSILNLGNGAQVANVFKANSFEILKAVAVCTWNENVSYRLEIYKNPETINVPTSGAMVSEQVGTIDFPGYTSIILDTPVKLSKDDLFAVVFTLSCPVPDDNGVYVQMPYDCTADMGWQGWVHANNGDTSFYCDAQGTWTDCPDNGDFRIKAYTDALNYSISVDSNNDSWGTVSVNGTTIEAVPSQGYAISDCMVLDGEADFTIDGNTIQVLPDSDCVIRVFFAEITDCTVGFFVDDTQIASQTVPLSQTITLPSTVSLAPTGWTFLGWVAQQLEETEEAPAFLAPGSVYAVRKNLSLYALFSRTEENALTGYRLLTGAPDNWAGDYVITYAENAYNMHVLKATTASSLTQKSLSNTTFAPALSDTQIKLHGKLLTNVDPVYLFNISQKDDSYRIYNKSKKSYVGASTSLYSCSSTQSSYLPWELSFTISGFPMLKSKAKNYYLNYDKTSKFFNVISDENTSIRLWRETTVDAIYYASIFEGMIHSHTVCSLEEIAPSCTEAGTKAYYYCSDPSCALFGKKYLDSDLTTELTDADMVLPALGHNPGEPIQENYIDPTTTEEGSYDLVTSCTRCGLQLEVEHVTLPVVASGSHEHNMVFTAEKAPTCTEAGNVAFYYCDGCGCYFSDENSVFPLTLDELSLPALSHSPGEAMIERENAPTCVESGSYDVVISCTRCGAELSRETIRVPSTGEHNYGEWLSNNNGTHTRTCSLCNTTQTETCSYTNVVTAPTPTSRGYTTHTCSGCGYTYNDAITCLVAFSVSNGVNAPSSQTVNINTSITLPAAPSPAVSGYSFIGWVASSVRGSTVCPDVLTSSYTVTDSVTLYALYSGNVPAYQCLTSAPSSWAGTYVISYAPDIANPNSMRVLRSVSTKTTASLSQSTYAQTLNTAGIAWNSIEGQDMLVKVDPKYQFTFTVHGNNYWIQNISRGSYLGGTTVLYALTQNYTRYLPWTMSFSDGSVLMKCSFKGNYLNYNTSNGYFVLSSSKSSNIYLWKELPEEVLCYTTELD